MHYAGFLFIEKFYTVMPECKKHCVPVLVGGDNPPFLVGKGLTDLPTIGPPAPPHPHPPSSGITPIYKLVYMYTVVYMANIVKLFSFFKKKSKVQ